MQPDVRFLKRTLLFQGLTEEEIACVLRCLSGRTVRFARQAFVFRAGDAVTDVGLVLTGSVHIVKEDYWGERTLVTELGEGELFGEAFAAARNEALPVSVIAVEPCDILLLDFRNLITPCGLACSFHTHLVGNLLGILAARNRMLNRKLEHVMQRTIRKKLLSYFSEQAIKNGSRKFRIPYNRQQLADYLGVDRSALSAELGKMRREGILTFHRQEFELLRKPPEAEEPSASGAG